jgi:hypothetical protein
VENEFSNFVMPVRGEGQWPGSVPEVEHVLRHCVLDLLANNPRHNVVNTQGWLIVHFDDWRYLIKAPSFACMPVAKGAYATHLRRWGEQIPFIAWLAFPSTLAGGGSFSNSVFTIGARALNEAVRSHESMERARQVEQGLVELAAMGAGAGLAEPLIVNLMPHLEPGVATGVAAVAGHLLTQLAKRVVRA